MPAPTHFIAFKDLQFNDKQIALIQIGERPVCITQYRGNWHAFLNRCPHAGATLEGGFVDALGYVVCPLHRYRFSVIHGRDAGNEGYRLKVFAVRTTEEGIYIES